MPYRQKLRFPLRLMYDSFGLQYTFIKEAVYYSIYSQFLMDMISTKELHLNQLCTIKKEAVLDPSVYQMNKIHNLCNYLFPNAGFFQLNFVC